MITNTDLVERAHAIIKRDSQLVSGGPNLFWNQPFSGLHGQEVQDFNEFYRLDKIDAQCMVGGSCDFEEVFEDYAEFAKRLRDEEQHDQKMIMATQMAFIMIITAAIDRYQM